MDRTKGERVTPTALQDYYPMGKFAYRLIPLPEYDCIYVKNPKAACSSVLLWMHRIHTNDLDFTPRNIHADHGLPRVPSEVSWEEVARMLDGEAFRFTFVRNPIRRAESAYADKILRRRRYPGREELQRTLGLPIDPTQDLTIDQFVAGLEAQDPLEMDQHWRPQHLNLMHPLVSYDLIGRVETFEADLARVRGQTGLPDIPAETRNATKKTPGGLLEDRPDLVRRLTAIYALDFELYGY